MSAVNKLIKNVLTYKALYLLMIPGILYFIIFHYIPMYGVLIAFKDFNFSKGILGSEWIGFKYFGILFKSPDFLQILRNTVLISLYRLVVGFPAPIILALLLNELKKLTYKKTIQTIVYFPHFLSWVVVGGIVFRFLSADGVLNTLLESMGMEQIPFLTSTKYFRSIVVVSGIWKETGWEAIIYLAALSGINPELYLAASIDGAGKLKQVWYITLPELRNTIIIILLLRVGRFLKVGFEQIFVLYNPFVYSVGDVFSTYIYRVGIEGARFSYSTAVGLFESLVGLILIVTTNKISNKIGDYGIW